MKSKILIIIIGILTLLSPISVEASRMRLERRLNDGGNNSLSKSKTLSGALKVGYNEILARSYAKSATQTWALNSLKFTRAVSGNFRNISVCNSSPSKVLNDLDLFPAVKDFISPNLDWSMGGYSQTYEEVILYFKLHCPNYKF